MNIEQFALLVHLIGFAIGLGGATVSDVTFFRALRNRKLTQETYEFLVSLSKIIWTGIVLLVISGLTFFLLSYLEQGRIGMLSSAKWQLKLTLVAIIIINGFYFRFGIFSALRGVIGKTLDLSSVGPIIWKLAASGTISIWSWYATLIVTLLPRGFLTNYFLGLIIYLGVLIVGIFISKLLITKTVKTL